MSHIEIPVKVTAWVDQGVAPLVEAINDFPQVITLDSCEGQNSIAHVDFSHRGSPSDFSDFFEKLSAALASRIHGDNDYRLRLEWTAGGDRPIGSILTHRNLVPQLAEAIKDFAEGHDVPEAEPPETVIKVWKTVAMRGEECDYVLIRGWQDFMSYLENSMDLFIEKFDDDTTDEGISIPIKTVSMMLAEYEQTLED